jgi:hypothetical protein
MDVKHFQKKIFNFVSAWDIKRNSEPTEQNTFNHLVEKIGELAREYVNKDSRPDKFNNVKLDNAIGDALIQLIKLGHLRGLDIENLVLKIIKDEQKLLEE